MGVDMSSPFEKERWLRLRRQVSTRRERLRRKHQLPTSVCDGAELTGAQQVVCRDDEASLAPLIARRDGALRKLEAAERGVEAACKPQPVDVSPGHPGRGQAQPPRRP